MYTYLAFYLNTSREPPAGASNSGQRYCSCMHKVIVEYMYVHRSKVDRDEATSASHAYADPQTWLKQHIVLYKDCMQRSDLGMLMAAQTMVW